MSGWRRLGRLLPRAGTDLPAWTGGFAALPFAVRDRETSARVYFTGRDARGRSQIGGCRLDLQRLEIVPGSVTPHPLLEPGPLGAFDDSGCSVGCVIYHGDRILLYYTGWMLGRTVPFYLAIGLAVSEDGGETFRRVAPTPVLDRAPCDPFLCASPSILVEGERWRMWYVSGVAWEPTADGSSKHFYLIKYAESRDGLSWERDGRIRLGFADPTEHALGRPHVVPHGDGYRMWFCGRGVAYRLLSADSLDGLDWRRSAAPPSLEPREGWDRQMQAYPMVLEDGARRILLYNGNRYGATGFGAAVAED